MHVTGTTTSSVLDEFASIVGLLLCISVMMSFISIRTESIKWTLLLERMANILFGIAIVGIALILLILLKTFWLE
ncbi:hypothetical protein [Frigoriflavimonas asaccharolytica]|uniref:Lysylphosphatidylglycerol synthetase-like protein (DUF2156 family) n=1 Tax=Frigoriflavimonas asaccharolytica TaxID=2735899 RepID=A0A8J8K9U7_9FLAO|nr:hypothetical protein [Frigoriflavimonas asaccharolytica]NRS94188.1 lysylphosphatidylglycerol synthetase-like protein (DUF2156 family) [Frigoriflavimonas asaccharolytica]